MRIPRKKKKQIPKNTPYCYIYGKICPFYTRKSYNEMNPTPSWVDVEFLEEYGDIKSGWCKLVKYEIDDQCKSCNIGGYY